MGDLLVRNIPEDLRDALKTRASMHNRSVSDEAKSLLEKALQTVDPEDEKKFVSLWDAFQETRREFSLTEDEHQEFARILEEARKAPDREVPESE